VFLRHLGQGSFCALAAVYLVACSAEPEGQSAQPLQVSVIAAETRTVPLYLEMVGATKGNQDVPIRARVEGFLESVDFEEGQFAKRNQLLYTIDAQPFQAKLIEAKSRLAAEQTRLAKAEADLSRIRPLAEMNAVSQQDLDGAVAQAEASAASVRAAEAGVQLAEIELGYTRIYAPIDGLMGLTQAKPGEFVGREPNPVVLNVLSDINPIRVRFSISEREYLTLARTFMAESPDGDFNKDVERRQNQNQLTLILADGTEYDEPGYVDASAQSIDPTTGTFTLEATFPNDRSLLLPGQFARVRAAYQTLDNAVVVPRQAIVELQGRFQVYVVGDDNKISVRTVTTGPISGNDIVVASGLEAGEQVVVEGIQKVRADMLVRPQPYQRARAPELLQET
jgi:membrane fusion protein (multidrug efflux system)